MNKGIPLFAGYVDGSFDSETDIFCADHFPIEGEGLTVSETERLDVDEPYCAVCKSAGYLVVLEETD